MLKKAKEQNATVERSELEEPDIRLLDGEETQRICPYMSMPCQEICPGWIAVVKDCLFHVCLTEVKEVFLKSARYLDEHLGLIDGIGLKTVKSLRQVMNGQATPEQREIVRSVLGSLISTGVLVKISSMTVEDISTLISNVESKISFAFGTLFEDEDVDQ